MSSMAAVLMRYQRRRITTMVNDLVTNCQGNCTVNASDVVCTTNTCSTLDLSQPVGCSPTGSLRLSQTFLLIVVSSCY
jgi:hypothetical protein